MNVLERKKLKFRSFNFPDSEFKSFFVRCRRTYVLNNNKKAKRLDTSKHQLFF